MNPAAASSSGSSGSGNGWTAAWYPATAAASLRLNSAAPQPMCIPRPRSTAYGSLRAGSARSSMTRRPGRTPDHRQGWAYASTGQPPPPAPAPGPAAGSVGPCPADGPPPGASACLTLPSVDRSGPGEQSHWSRGTGPSGRSSHADHPGGGSSPVRPSTASRSRSACPVWRPYSSIRSKIRQAQARVPPGGRRRAPVDRDHPRASGGRREPASAGPHHPRGRRAAPACRRRRS